MKVKLPILCAILLVAFNISSQENILNSLLIPSKLKENANAVIRSSELNIAITATNNMSVIEKRTITVLNKEGDELVNAEVYYDNNVKIKVLEVLVYNQFGALVKKIKKNDFKDVSAVSGGTLYSDSRLKYLEYTPISYPYTLVFNCETSTSNTAFIEPFMPITNYFISVENSFYTVSFPTELTIKSKEKNLENFEVTKEAVPSKISYSLKNMQAIKPEDYSPSLIDLVPKVLVTSNRFSLEGFQTEVEDWSSFGKWVYTDLLQDTHDLPASTIAMVQNLIKDETNDFDKARKIYEYVQNKTRYISVQIGIGGWKPFKASEVDRLGYGDCKGLTNYTLALLQAVGIKSNYTVLYAGDSQRNLESDFAAMQGDHAILNIPQENSEDIWLECTNQKLPFGFIGNFTDDRDVLVVTPEGGKIKHTKKYSTNENTQLIKGKYSVTNEGNINVQATINSAGIQYDNKYWLETETPRDLDTHYKKRWNYVNGIYIENMHINNNKITNQFIEDVSFQATSYTKKAGNRMLLTVNALNRNTEVPDRYRDRKHPLKIERGFKNVDEVEIKLPSDYSIESSPQNVFIENKFGYYKAELQPKADNTLIYKREFVINDGDFPKEDYDAFREFYKNVSTQDNSKITLIKK